MGNLHFDDVIKVDRVDVDGKKYDKVSRIEARCEELDMNLQLDVNTELYPIRVGDKFRTVLAETLNEDGSAVTSYFPEGKKKSLADKFEYVMHGLLYKISEDKSGPNLEAVVYISFGGLQLALKGDATKMGKFKVDQKLFLLMRKIVEVLEFIAKQGGIELPHQLAEKIADNSKNNLCDKPYVHSRKPGDLSNRYSTICCL